MYEDEILGVSYVMLAAGVLATFLVSSLDLCPVIVLPPPCLTSEALRMVGLDPAGEEEESLLLSYLQNE